MKRRLRLKPRESNWKRKKPKRKGSNWRLRGKESKMKKTKYYRKRFFRKI